MNTQEVIDHLASEKPFNAMLKREILVRLRKFKFNEDCANAALKQENAIMFGKVMLAKKAAEEARINRYAAKVMRDTDPSFGVVAYAILDNDGTLYSKLEVDDLLQRILGTLE